MTKIPVFSKLLFEAFSKASLSPLEFSSKVAESKSRIENILVGKGPLPADLDSWFKVFSLNSVEKKLWEAAAAIYKLPIEKQMLFKTHFNTIFSMAPVRGTMMLADKVYCDAFTGKWIVAGTYCQYNSSKDPFDVPDLKFYVRLQVERPGKFPSSIFAVDSSSSPTIAKLWELNFELEIPARGIPVYETMVTVPGPTITFPVPTEQRKPGELLIMKTSIWLRVDQTEVASCPLDFTIRPLTKVPKSNENPDSTIDSPSQR